MIERGRLGQKNEMRRLEETVQQRSPTLAKFYQLERTRSALSHSRWAALSSVNRGIAAALGVEIQPLHQSTEDPFCEDTGYCSAGVCWCQTKPNLRPHAHAVGLALKVKSSAKNENCCRCLSTVITCQNISKLACAAPCQNAD